MKRLLRAMGWPILITGLLGICFSFFAKAPFIIGVLFALFFFASGAVLQWSKQKPGGIDNPELGAPHYPLYTLLISMGTFVGLIVIIYWFPDIKNYDFFR
ncbi:MAG: uncharacterized BrkB/YihY/UPF0761 family membrane protein [Arenicella sp.]|jgi:uncharacterized BrkB/YihY/UPF0761 family membrane protein